MDMVGDQMAGNSKICRLSVRTHIICEHYQTVTTLFVMEIVTELKPLRLFPEGYGLNAIPYQPEPVSNQCFHTCRVCAGITKSNVSIFKTCNTTETLRRTTLRHTGWQQK